MKFAVIGHPISHSLSPVMHHANFKALGRNDSYIALDVHPDHFHHIRDIITEYELDGFNVTIPFKTDIMHYLDAIDDHALAIGAVNTVKINEGKWTGYNTDGIGFLASLPSMPTAGTHVLIIGAGGAGRAIAQAFKQYGAEVTVANRTVERLMNWPDTVTKIGLEDLSHHAQHADIIVNTTPLGMTGFGDTCIYDFNTAQEGVIVADVIYTPSMTPFLTAAADKQLKIVTGLGMFINQGAESFEIWTGLKADRVAMKKCVEQYL
ncbi:shikimate dehydrogenase [Macrococcus hajekii]|uniref:Shikimate dehydrogenase (NADP(+)) n=1 Tax=Macrococcus hajekii TaxID=198482 RepID=A0A4V3BE63_9STAP|nr:shikimate dehydrogenase [Macrococcus hajekii]TDM02855.1 shikimate dehydrogenase [Macrococcus hajekii]GGB04426.1 shikimate dehydrogenase (NADP(+)) [Macrococcus hajekii]